MSLSFSSKIGLLLLCLCVLIAGCDPVISLAGANFPVWTLCLLGGVLGALLLRPLLVTSGLDNWMTPRPLVYGCLALTISFVCWLLLWK